MKRSMCFLFMTWSEVSHVVMLKEKIEQLYNKLNKETEIFAEKKIGSEFSNLVGKNTKDLTQIWQKLFL